MFFLDPCEVANSREPFEPEARFVNCDYNTYSSLCDRYITPGWYRYKSNMLDRCPSLLNCGALYPNWLNGKIHILFCFSCLTIYDLLIPTKITIILLFFYVHYKSEIELPFNAVF